LILTNKVVVVTGAANGIGRALCERFLAEGARAVIPADLEGEPAVDVTDEGQVQALVRRVESEYGRIDLFCSNAGILIEGGVEVPDDEWDRIWSVNVKAHLYAARAVLPGMIARAA
jgi:NAD(P)-dependent dehydrogenase (short-subunit alcohol dehydrogenase family)